MTDLTQNWPQHCYHRVDALDMPPDTPIPGQETMAGMIFDAYRGRRTEDQAMPVELLAAADQYRKQIWPLSDRYYETMPAWKPAGAYKPDDMETAVSMIFDARSGSGRYKPDDGQDPKEDAEIGAHDLTAAAVYPGSYTTAEIMKIVKNVIPPGLPFGINIYTAEGVLDVQLFSGLYVLHTVLDSSPPDIWDWGRPRVIANMVAGFQAVEYLWQAVEDTADMDYPLNGFIDYALRELLRHNQSVQAAKVLTAGKGNLARISNAGRTAAAAEWEQLPDAVVVEVDGEAVSTPLHYAPRRARPRRREAGTLMPLPGTAQAGDVRLALLQDLEQYAGIDRRNPLPGDTLYLLTLGAALCGPLTIYADQLGAMMAGQFDPAGAQPSQRERWRHRAWAALRWASSWRQLPDGHWRQLLAITTADLPPGHARVYPFCWDQHGKGYRLTGVLANQAIRQDKRGSLGRLAAGIEDFISAAAAPAGERRSRLLIPEKKGGPGPRSEFIPYPLLLARSGFYFDLTDKRDLDATKQLWRRLCALLKSKGYVLPRLSAEAEAGDTFEIVEIVKGRPGPGSHFGGVRIRASARFIEAQSIVNRRKIDRGLTAIPLPRLFAH